VSLKSCVSLRDIRFGFGPQQDVLNIAALDVQRGERLFIQGPSGSGKSTLLGVIGGVLTPTAGTVTVLGESLNAMSAARRDRFRADHIGFVFQQFNLLPYLNVLDNVTLPLEFSPLRRKRALEGGQTPALVAKELLRMLDLNDSRLLKRAATELSVGQQQRVAVARALIGSPELIIADEPTSALDTDTRERFLTLLFDACAQSGITVLFVSHDHTLKGAFDRVLDLNVLNAVPA